MPILFPPAQRKEKTIKPGKPLREIPFEHLYIGMPVVNYNPCGIEIQNEYGNIVYLHKSNYDNYLGVPVERTFILIKDCYEEAPYHYMLVIIKIGNESPREDSTTTNWCADLSRL